jgi:hypothetical protein
VALTSNSTINLNNMNCLVSYDNSLAQTTPRIVNRYIFSLSVDILRVSERLIPSAL